MSGRLQNISFERASVIMVLAGVQMSAISLFSLKNTETDMDAERPVRLVHLPPAPLADLPEMDAFFTFTETEVNLQMELPLPPPGTYPDIARQFAALDPIKVPPPPGRKQQPQIGPTAPMVYAAAETVPQTDPHAATQQTLQAIFCARLTAHDGAACQAEAPLNVPDTDFHRVQVGAALAPAPNARFQTVDSLASDIDVFDTTFERRPSAGMPTANEARFALGQIQLADMRVTQFSAF